MRVQGGRLMIDVKRWQQENVAVIAEFRANGGVVGGATPDAR